MSGYIDQTIFMKINLMSSWIKIIFVSKYFNIANSPKQQKSRWKTMFIPTRKANSS